MKIRKIKIENYRLLKNFVIDLEDELSLVIGKNNTGKTSLLSALDKCLNKSERNKFIFEDFNLDFKKNLEDLIQTDVIEIDKYRPQGIKLKLFIEYNQNDDLSNISRVMMDLDPNNNFIILSFEYVLTKDNLQRIRDDFKTFKQKKEEGGAEKKINTLDVFLKQNITDYFKNSIKTISYDLQSKNEDDDIYIDLENEKSTVQNILSFKYISAQRDVHNKELDKTLSIQTSKIYKKTEASDEQQNAITEFKDQLIQTDSVLSGIYEKLFKEVVSKVKRFGGIKPDDSIIKIESTLQHRDLLDGNTTVMYDHDGHTLPEHYNGLGYMNLISIIFEIEILLKEFKKSKSEEPADINLLFIEEPEAHTHPQMQYVFINNIKELIKDGMVREDGFCMELQYIISTHSSHIVSESDFDDIKYLKKEANNSVVAMNLKSLETEYVSNGEEQKYRFLKQYLTLNRTELFFADKAILIEGDTERILLPAMMKKIDQESAINPLLSQNISIIEVGAHSQTFEKFIDFIGIKTLIITDIDSGKKDGSDTVQCRVADANASVTTNSSLKFFFNSTDLAFYKKRQIKENTLSKKQIDKKWILDQNGHVLVVYQTEDKDNKGESYYARSFEDSFFHLNKEFIIDVANSFSSLVNKHMVKFRANEIDAYDFAKHAVGSKPSLAIEILLNSKDNKKGDEFSNWETPKYIREGLKWLQQN